MLVRWTDCPTIAVLGGISTPTFVLGLMLSYVFFFKFEQWGLPYLLGGAVITEQVYGLQGVGQLVLHASTNGDLPLIIGVVLLVAALVTAANLVVDIGYAILDPRVRLG